MEKAGPAVVPALELQKQNSWSLDIERDEAWEHRRRGMRRGGTALRSMRSVTDDDLDELRECMDLGFGFELHLAGSECAVCGCAGRNRFLEGGAEGLTCS